MKKLFQFILAAGVIAILLAALFKEMHWKGQHELLLTGICILLAAMVVYIVDLLRKPDSKN